MAGKNVRKVIRCRAEEDSRSWSRATLAGRSPGFPKVADLLAFFIEEQPRALREPCIPFGDRHLNPRPHLSVDRQRVRFLGLRRPSGILNLFPDDIRLSDADLLQFAPP